MEVLYKSIFFSIGKPGHLLKVNNSFPLEYNYARKIFHPKMSSRVINNLEQ